MKKRLFYSLICLLILNLLLTQKTFAQTATKEGENILQKIRQKVEAIRSSPRAYIGTVTDKTQDSIQIKDLDGKIQQVSVKDQVTFIKNLTKTTNNVKFTDLGIGDFVIVMGLQNGTSVLDARRVLITNPIDETERKITFGEITAIGKKDVAIKDKNGAQTTFVFPKRWKGPDVKELKEGMKVIVVAVKDETNNLSVRTISIINIAGISSSPSPTPKARLTPRPTISE